MPRAVERARATQDLARHVQQNAKVDLDGKDRNAHNHGQREGAQYGQDDVALLDQGELHFFLFGLFFAADAIALLVEHLDVESACRLARTSRCMHAVLREHTQECKRAAYERLQNFDTQTDFFSVQRTWSQFNALYNVRKEIAVRRRVGRARVTAREFQFGFYTGRKDEWHHCFLTLPPLWTGLGARLRVVTYDNRDDERIVTRTFKNIHRVETLDRILETCNWHSSLCILGERWSYTRGQTRPMLWLGFEE